MQTDAISRLIEMKKEELENLRKDLVQLKRIQEEAQLAYTFAVEEKEEFINIMRQSESNQQSFIANMMINHRDFLKHLHTQSIDSERALLEVTKQTDLAQYGLKQAYIEMKSLELIAERKSKAKQSKLARNQFSVSDDEELVRFGKIKQSHAEH